MHISILIVAGLLALYLLGNALYYTGPFLYGWWCRPNASAPKENEEGVCEDDFYLYRVGIESDDEDWDETW